MGHLKDHVEKLFYFQVAAEKGSIHRAAVVLSITQSSLSTSIKVLEQSIGTLLFDRSPAGVKLTTDGKIVYEYSKKLSKEIQDLEMKLSGTVSG